MPPSFSAGEAALAGEAAGAGAAVPVGVEGGGQREVAAMAFCTTSVSGSPGERDRESVVELVFTSLANHKCKLLVLSTGKECTHIDVCMHLILSRKLTTLERHQLHHVCA